MPPLLIYIVLVPIIFIVSFIIFSIIIFLFYRYILRAKNNLREKILGTFIISIISSLYYPVFDLGYQIYLDSSGNIYRNIGWGETFQVPLHDPYVISSWQDLEGSWELAPIPSMHKGGKIDKVAVKVPMIIFFDTYRRYGIIHSEKGEIE